MRPKSTLNLIEIDPYCFYSTGLYETLLNNINVAEAGAFVRLTWYASIRTSSWQTVYPRGPRKLCQAGQRHAQHGME